MRYVVGFVGVVALVALPLSAPAQDVEEGAASEPKGEGPVPEEGSLQLKLDDAGVDVTPTTPPRTADRYTPEEMELRVKRARIGLYVSVGVYVIGLAVAIPGAVGDCGYVCWGYATLAARCDPLLRTGIAVAALGVVGMIASGVMLKLAKRKRGRNRQMQACHGTPRRVQWDPARTLLVF